MTPDIALVLALLLVAMVFLSFEWLSVDVVRHCQRKLHGCTKLLSRSVRQRHLISRCSLRQFRAEAMEQWRDVTAAA